MVRRRRPEMDSQRMTLAPGVLAVPNVRLVRKIAEGGMGSVWEAEHLALRTTVAVKFVLDEFDDNAEAVARFDREATAAARIKSPHVVQVLDHGVSAEGVPYIVMEHLEGEDLEARIERQPRLSLELVVHIVAQSAKALDKAHSLGIVHRDIKPSNVFLTDVGGEVFVKILDFGIAKLAIGVPGAEMRMTQTGAMIGTPVFMAPEQMTQAKNVGPAADMWSLGVVAYLALTHKLPYESDTVAGLAMAIERGGFTPVTSIVPTLPKEIDAWFSQALAKDPEKRFASIKVMAEALAMASGTHAPVSVALRSGGTGAPPAEPAKAADAHASPTPLPTLDEPEPQRTTLAASPLGTATIMGASSEKSRQDARSTRTRLVAVIGGVVALGIVALVVVMNAGEGSHSADSGSSQNTSTASATGSATTTTTTRPGGATTSATATTTTPDSKTTQPTATQATSESGAHSSTTGPSARPPLTGRLPTASARPSTSSTASSKPTTSATTTATASAKPTASSTASGKPTAAPPASNKPTPKPAGS
ncbi:MAG: serine/threonine-protein kinase [Polyangiaceae bacterium]